MISNSHHYKKPNIEIKQALHACSIDINYIEKNYILKTRNCTHPNDPVCGLPLLILKQLNIISKRSRINYPLTLLSRDNTD